jgi:predicted ATP-dependent endonuclease of OLD family
VKSVTNGKLKLLAARVTNFRCFADTGEVPLEAVTVLIAENEHGKTAFLEALAWFSSDEALDEDDRWTGAARGGAVPVVALTFELSEKAKTALGDGRFRVPARVIIRKNSDATFEVLDGNSGASLAEDVLAVRKQQFDQARSSLLNLLRGYSFSSEEQRLAGDEVSKLLQDAKPDDYRASQVAAILNPLVVDNPGTIGTQLGSALQRLVDAEQSALGTDVDPLPALRAFLPRLLYFDGSVDLLPDVAEYAAVQADPEANRQVLNLARLVGFDLLQIVQDRHRRQLESRRFSTELSERTSRYWQGERVTFHVTAEESALVISIEYGGRNQKPSRHSRGMQWYLGFYVKFMAEASKELENAVLLIDEPGLSLHVKQQKKLLELFDDLARKNTIVYSTHLPYMIPSSHLHRLRLFVPDADHPGAIRVESKMQALPSRADVLKPVRAALGVGIAESITLGDATVIVEGPADTYILDGAATFCRAAGLPSLSPEVLTLPAGGAGEKMLPLAAFCAGEQMRGVVLVDDDAEGQRAERLITHRFEGLVAVVRTHQGSGAATGLELEDLLEREYYLELVNDAYRGVARFADLTLPNLPENVPITDALKQVFTDRGWGGFQKLRVARELQVRAELGQDAPPRTSLERFSELFERLNQGLASDLQENGSPADS